MVRSETSLDPLLIISTDKASNVPIIADSKAVKNENIKVFIITSLTGTIEKIEKADLRFTPRRAKAPTKGTTPKAKM